MATKKLKTVKEGRTNSAWLRYDRIKDNNILGIYSKWVKNIFISDDSPMVRSACSELVKGIRGLTGIEPSIQNMWNDTPKFPCIILRIIKGLSQKGKAIDESEADGIGEEGFVIKTTKVQDQDCIIITGKTGKGVLYGVFRLIRCMQLQQDISKIKVAENPQNPLRLINHWDNLDGSVERGYAGSSIFFKNNRITGNIKKIREYARLLASVGINGVAINNVNVHQRETMLITDKYFNSLSRIAEVFRDYGIKLFLSVNYASSIELGEMDTADPIDPKVCEWWRKKTEELYSHIPDLGGYLVKADSEFRPGPFTYGRNHADGANMLAKALKPFGGIVIWRCFVYNCLQDWRDHSTDRARAAYDHFKPLDGMFDDNVVLQVKNGPMDFQVREPVSPMFGGLEKTNQAVEFQITQEYTGQQKHLCYLVPMWKEVLEFDTCAKGKGSTVKRIVNGSLFNSSYGGVVGVSNIGDDPYWTGFQMAQSNLYGFGRLAWNPDLSAESITDEWVKMTFSNEPGIVGVISAMLLDSWRIYENYTVPLGIGWMVNPNHHFGPNVDGYEYAKWGTYHRADCNAIGVDRTVKSGTGYVGQYRKKVAEIYENINSCPEELLLFFHRIPYNYKLNSGETLIQYIYNAHFDGVEQVEELRKQWSSLEGKIQCELYKHVSDRLAMQKEYAVEWRDVINSYFYRKTGIADEKGRMIYV